MQTFASIARGATACAVLALCATPVLAEGKGYRAQQALAMAQGKIDAAAKVNASAEVPDIEAQAEAALRAANEAVAAGHKEEAIAYCERNAIASTNVR